MISDMLAWYIANFITSDYDFAGILLRSEDEIPDMIEASELACGSNMEIATKAIGRALWHFKPRAEEEQSK